METVFTFVGTAGNQVRAKVTEPPVNALQTIFTVHSLVGNLFGCTCQLFIHSSGYGVPLSVGDDLSLLSLEKLEHHWVSEGNKPIEIQKNLDCQSRLLSIKHMLVKLGKERIKTNRWVGGRGFFLITLFLE